MKIKQDPRLNEYRKKVDELRAEIKRLQGVSRKQKAEIKKLEGLVVDGAREAGLVPE